MRLLWVLLSLFLASPARAQTTVRVTPLNQQAIVQVPCGSAVASCILKASPGNFYGVYADCTAACWVMVFNRTTVPSNGSTTAGTASGNMRECFDVASGSSKSLTYQYPVAYDTGITVVISSTACDSLTLSSVGFISGAVGP